MSPGSGCTCILCRGSIACVSPWKCLHLQLVPRCLQLVCLYGGGCTCILCRGSIAYVPPWKQLHLQGLPLYIHTIHAHTCIHICRYFRLPNSETMPGMLPAVSSESVTFKNCLSCWSLTNGTQKNHWTIRLVSPECSVLQRHPLPACRPSAWKGFGERGP